MKIAVVGSRNFDDRGLMWRILLDKFSDADDVLISGGAKGVDTWAENFADENEIEKQIFLPDWKKHGKSAGPIRNKQIVKEADEVIAFWDGSSLGTKHTVKIAEQMGKHVTLIISKPRLAPPDTEEPAQEEA